MLPSSGHVHTTGRPELMSTPETPQTRAQDEAEDLERELRYRIRQLLDTPLPEEVDACVAELDWRCIVCARMREIAAQVSTACDFLVAVAEEELLPAGDDVYDDIGPLPPLPGDEDPQTREEYVRRLEEASKFWDRPEVERAYERIALGLPPFPDDEED
jgi:hypothetical protein